MLVEPNPIKKIATSLQTAHQELKVCALKMLASRDKGQGERKKPGCITQAAVKSLS